MTAGLFSHSGIRARSQRTCPEKRERVTRNKQKSYKSPKDKAQRERKNSKKAMEMNNMTYGTKNKEATPGHSIAKLRMRERRSLKLRRIKNQKSEQHLPFQQQKQDSRKFMSAFQENKHPTRMSAMAHASRWLPRSLVQRAAFSSHSSLFRKGNYK